MNFRNISSWCIRNPVPPIVLFAILTIVGLVSFIRMPVAKNPDIDFPGVIITISQPGAAPTEMETQVTQKVEAAARSVNGVDEIDSSLREGSSTTVVQFQIGTPVDRAVNDIRDAIAQIRGDLPEGILQPQVQRMAVNGQPVTYVAARATDMTLEQLSWFVDNDVARRVLGQPGVAQVSREGGVTRQINVILDPAAMSAQGITAAEVNQQLRQTNVDAAGGRAEIAGSEQSVRVLGNAHSAYDLSQTQIALPGGRTVRLADIARVQDSFSEQRTLAKLDGQQVVTFNISRAPSTSDVDVYNAAWSELHKLEKEDPRVHFTEIQNTVDYTKQQYKSSMEALFEGAILAVLIVFLFLRDIRATAISALAIPLSSIPAFWLMSLLGLNLNFLSLLAMSLVAGVLVDDAIVEIENIVRHMRMGKSAYQASIDAADEIGLAVLATTMAIVAVFLPVALMPGISGQFFKSFGFTVVVSVLMSLLVARMITPLLAAYFLKSHGAAPHASGRAMDRYLSVLSWTLRHRWVAVVAGVGTVVVTAVLIATVKMSFFPLENDENSQFRVGMAPGTTLEQTAEVTGRAAAIIAADKANVAHVFERTFVGSGYLNVVLKKDRPLKSYQFEQKIAPVLSKIADAQVTVMAQNSGGPGGGISRDIMLFLGSEDPAKLDAAANRIDEEMSGMSEIRAPRIAGDQLRPEITIKPHSDLAADLGVTTQALSQTIRIATLGDIEQNSAKFSLSDRQVPIEVMIDPSQRRDLSALENLPVPTKNGGSVPLKSVAEVGFGAGPANVQRTNQVRRTVVTADLAPGVASSDAWKKINELPAVKSLPAGVSKLNIGTQKWQGELVTSFAIALASGIMLVFAVLVLLYRRFLAPLVNLGSLLLAPFGAMIALHISGTPLSLPVFIGLLMLFGIVAKNSILLIDFAVEMMEHGMTKDEAIYEAGHKRAQPIVMTTVAMVAGMLPVSLSLTGDASWRAPMGITVIGGLIFSTMLTLLLVPAFFSLAIDVEGWLGRKLGRLIDNGEPGSVQAAPVPAE